MGVRRGRFRSPGRASAFLALLSVTTASAQPLAGQTGLVLAGHVGSSAAAPGGVMVDLAAEVQRGIFGVRAGGAMDAAGTALAPVFSARGSASSGAWSADLDLGLNVGRIPYVGTLFGRSDPSLFVGTGLAGIAGAGDPEGQRAGSVVPTWTWGVRGGLPLASWLSVEVEGRHRQTYAEVEPDVYPVREGWEYRAGLALRFGGGSSARSARLPGAGRSASGGGRATRPVGRDARRGASAAEVADGAIRTAERYIGTPYRWGGESPSEGFDCSGFVQYVFAEHGIFLPRVSRDQARAGQALPTTLQRIARGDLLFFAQNGRTVDHVAIYAGDGRIVHSSSSGSGVRYDDLAGNRGRWYVDHLVAVRRVIVDGDYLVDGSGPTLPPTRRSLPLDEAFEAIEAGRGDGAPPPEG